MSKATVFLQARVEVSQKSLSLSEKFCSQDRYRHASPLLNDMKPLNNFQLNVYNILCFICKYKQNLNPPVFRNSFTHRAKTKHALRNENSIQETICRKNFI